LQNIFFGWAKFDKKTRLCGQNKNNSKFIKNFPNATQNGLTELL
jgi:hypothetical protein